MKEFIVDDSSLSVVSAFFTIFAYNELKEQLDRIKEMRFLFGDPEFIKSVDPSRKALKAFIVSTDGIVLRDVLKMKPIAKECSEWIREKVEIRSITKSNFLHGKLYHILDGKTEQAMVGSSNLTVRGIGLSKNSSNVELNLIVKDDRDREDLKLWFDELWNDEDAVSDVKEEVLRYLHQLYSDASPEFIYYKTLFHLFEKYLDDKELSEDALAATTLLDCDIWKTLYDFQKDGVKGAINKILEFNGCILADSVGLGKTYTALAIIKYFELRNERVLVLCPKKLRENWVVYRRNDQLNPFINDRFRYDVLSHTDLSRESGMTGDINLATLNWSNYDLVVIDESHNFRNNSPGTRDEDGNIIRQSRYRRLMDDIIKTGVRTKVLLISATPVNNNLKDLRNQIYFISSESDSAFSDNIGIPDIGETLRQAQAQFTSWSKLQETARTTGLLLERLGADFFKLLDQLTIARARKHIQKYYDHELERLGQFPVRLKPISKYTRIDLEDLFLSYDMIAEDIDSYKLSLFNPASYLKEEMPEDRRREYDRKEGNFTQAQREGFLVGMMRVNFLKRLESSVHAFALTMHRTTEKIERLEGRLRAFQQFQSDNPEIDLGAIDPEEIDDDELVDAMEVGKKLKYRTTDLRIDDWLKDLAKDKQQLHGLYLQAVDVNPNRDAKLHELKTLIEAKIKHRRKSKSGNLTRKILVFTAFTDTAMYLYENLCDWALETLGLYSAVVTGSAANRTNYVPATKPIKTDFNSILINFSPLSKKRSRMDHMPQEGEIDLLIATDCISEGQNLQDCDFLVNYDIHWNPVRIIQRFGRIDRIGSINESVQLVNFWPTDNLDKYISLKQRVEARMALVDISATLEDNILNPEELEDLVKADLLYRDRQLKRMMKEVLDLEDLNESLSLTEFSLEDFRIDLLNYLDANREALESAPFGHYTVVPSEGNSHPARPGVIFCLKKRTGSIKKDSSERSSGTVNPVDPYYLVYVLEDGNIRFTFVHPKQILNVFRDLCAGRSTAFHKLCAEFDQATGYGKEMGDYSVFLENAVTSIKRTFRSRATHKLKASRDFILPSKEDQGQSTDDFDLVTWLVIKSNQ